jgi:hypothetical protein
MFSSCAASLKTRARATYMADVIAFRLVGRFNCTRSNGCASHRWRKARLATDDQECLVNPTSAASWIRSGIPLTMPRPDEPAQ